MHIQSIALQSQTILWSIGKQLSTRTEPSLYSHCSIRCSGNRLLNSACRALRPRRLLNMTLRELNCCAVALQLSFGLEIITLLLLLLGHKLLLTEPTRLTYKAERKRNTRLVLKHANPISGIKAQFWSSHVFFCRFTCTLVTRVTKLKQ